jgi:hypothetical protein
MAGGSVQEVDCGNFMGIMGIDGVDLGKGFGSAIKQVWQLESMTTLT